MSEISSAAMTERTKMLLTDNEFGNGAATPRSTGVSPRIARIE